MEDSLEPERKTLEMEATGAETRQTDSNTSTGGTSPWLIADGIANVFLLFFLMTTIEECGIYGFFSRFQAGTNAVIRARQLTRNVTSLESLDNWDAIATWLEFTYTRSIFQQDAFTQVCDYDGFFAEEYVYGRMGLVPSFTVRVLGETSDLWGCESGYFNFANEIPVGPKFNLNPAKDCDVATRGMDIGKFFFSFAWGFNCDQSNPTWPSMIASQCCGNTCENGTYCESGNFEYELPNEVLGPSPTEAELYFVTEPFTESECPDTSFLPRGYLNGSKTLNPAYDFWLNRFQSNTVEDVSRLLQRTWKEVGALYSNYSFSFSGLASGQPGFLPGDYTSQGPIMLFDTNETCRSQFQKRGDDYVAASSRYLTNRILQAVDEKSSGLVMTAYLPLGTGLNVDIVNVFQIQQVSSTACQWQSSDV